MIAQEHLEEGTSCLTQKNRGGGIIWNVRTLIFTLPPPRPPHTFGGPEGMRNCEEELPSCVRLGMEALWKIEKK